MFWILVIALLVAAVILPGVWVRKILAKYSEPADRYQEQGSGSELARHLLDRFELTEVQVEASDTGDHYDPGDRTVRLTEANFNGHSLTAITVAAHEVSHALQHAKGEALFSNDF